MVLGSPSSRWRTVSSVPSPSTMQVRRSVPNKRLSRTLTLVPVWLKRKPRSRMASTRPIIQAGGGHVAKWRVGGVASNGACALAYRPKAMLRASAGCLKTAAGEPAWITRPARSSRVISDCQRFFRIVRYQNTSDLSSANNTEDLFAYRGAKVGVQACKRFVRSRAVARRKRARPRAMRVVHPSRYAATVCQLTNAASLKPRVGALAALFAWQVTQANGDVLPRAFVAEERVVLKDQADAPFCAGVSLPAVALHRPTETLPSTRGSSPAITRRAVLLPQPDGPTRAVIAPAGACRETSVSTGTRPSAGRRWLSVRPRASQIADQ